MISHLCNLAKGTHYTLLQNGMKSENTQIIKKKVTLILLNNPEVNEFIPHLCQEYKGTIWLFRTKCGLIILQRIPGYLRESKTYK